LSLDRSLPLDWYKYINNKDKIFKLGNMKTSYLETKLLRGITRATSKNDSSCREVVN